MIVLMMQFSGVSARVEPRSVMNRHIPQRPLRDATHSQWQWQRDHVNRRRVPQGAVPDVAYTDPGDGKERIVELRFIKQCLSTRGGTVARWRQAYVPL
jgi:hypothetical protein